MPARVLLEEPRGSRLLSQLLGSPRCDSCALLPEAGGRAVCTPWAPPLPSPLPESVGFALSQVLGTARWPVRKQQQEEGQPAPGGGGALQPQGPDAHLLPGLRSHGSRGETQGSPARTPACRSRSCSPRGAGSPPRRRGLHHSPAGAQAREQGREGRAVLTGKPSGGPGPGARQTARAPSSRPTA